MIGEDLRQATGAQPLEALLELQRRDASRTHNRSSERFGMQCRIELYLGDSGRRNSRPPIVAVCSDLSAGGCRLIAESPPAVGDIYWVTFEKSVDLPPAFARCVRCRLLREDAFEGGFQFFNEITMPNSQRREEDDIVDMV